MTHTQMRNLIAAAVAAAALAACAQSDVEITNPNSPLASQAASDPTALQLLATGLLTDMRGTRAGVISNTGILGRESYNYTPQEGRNTTNYLIGITVNGKQELDPAGFATGVWGGEFGAIRDIYNFKNTLTAATNRTAAEKAGAIAFAETIEALMQFEILQTRDSLGTITEIKESPLELAPFVTRDSGYKYAMNLLDDAATKLGQAGATFPFTLGPGFGSAVAGQNFNTPATFLQFNRALKARIAVNYATLGGGSAAWQAALTALGQSFLNAGATTRAAFDVGAYDTYAPSPDSPNSLTQATNTNLYAHMSIQADAQLQASGQPDQRYLNKIRTGLPSRQGPNNGGPTSAASTLGYSIWPTTSSPIPIIRNEELILLRAEAKLGTGDKAGAIADANIVRVNSGGLPPLTLTAGSPDSDILKAILYEKRYSLMMEGHRWSDLRRYGLLNTLPLDITSGANKNFVAKVMPVPQSECLNRLAKGGAFVGPNGLNDCVP